MSHRSRAAVLVLPLIVLAACGTGTDESPTAAGDAPVAEASTSVAADAPAGDGEATECAPVSSPMVEVNAMDDEPRLEIPQPAGWERNTQMDSEIVRLTLVNTSLAKDSFAPNLVVTAEPSSPDPQQAFEVQLGAMREGLGLTDVDSTEGELCGHPTMTVDYMLPAMGGVPERPATMTALVVPDGEQAVTYTFTAQATAPLDPAYERDVQTMLEGVQVSD